MVEGLDRFRDHFEKFVDQYILIGGAACTVAMESIGESFRATKDLDIVLCAEALDASFVASFWTFIRDGQYQIQQNAKGDNQYYRFQRPSDLAFPFMLELFSRSPDQFAPAEGSVLTPIPMGEDISSLSAILLDDSYYSFLQSGKKVVDGIPIATAEQLVPLKARAWLDLSERKADGDHVDSRDIKKHKNDVFRLFPILDPEFSAVVPDNVKSDLVRFLDRIKSETIDFKSFGLSGQTIETIGAELGRIYGF
ncbi:hypothetical protein NZK35_05545 [Stieleria sp. ICT_E10.1]|uniref:hypothetical protein n=1 Tax=Stieleria sedimenti TaxID=2976331 RepID=UPI00217F506E|nr:hypothetical protein [Stieleria sedimenti]MCS7466137.1 hypothetical protein [Stieleria sedimenti]